FLSKETDFQLSDKQIAATAKYMQPNGTLVKGEKLDRGISWCLPPGYAYKLPEQTFASALKELFEVFLKRE
ncbi:hypothetical protein HK097_009086, partial [Rhizophlyctis rosea]